MKPDLAHVLGVRAFGLPIIENRYLRIGETLYVSTDGVEAIYTGSAALFSFQVWAYGQRLDTLATVERIFREQS